MKKKTHVQEGYVPFVIEAVYILAHALRGMINAKCPRVFKNKEKFKNCPLSTVGFEGYELLQFIRNVSFVGKTLSLPYVHHSVNLIQITGVQGESVRLDEKGDRTDPTYDIYQFRGAKKGYVRIGDWANGYAIAKYKINSS